MGAEGRERFAREGGTGRSASRPLVAISSSLDESLGALRAPLDADLSTEVVAVVVRRALDLDTSPRNLRAIVKPGDWVVVKPNIVTSPTNPKCMYWCDGVPHRGQNTDLRAVKALIDYILTHCQPRRITIAEGAAEWERVGEPDTDPSITEDGWTVHWPEYGGLSYVDLVAGWARTHPGVVDIVDLNYDERRFEPVPDPRGSGVGALQRRFAEMRPAERYGRSSYVDGTGTLREGYEMPATILDCDVLVGLAAMKTHLTSGTSLTFKNFVGVTPPNFGRDAPRLGRNHKSPVHEGEICRGFVDAFCYHPTDYAVVEGFWGTEGNGPQWGDDVQHNVVICGADPVAVDAVGSVAMGYNPEDLEYLHRAVRKRLGEMDLRRVEVVGTPVESVQRLYRMGSGKSGRLYAGRGLRDWLVAPAGPAGDVRDGDWVRIDSEDRYVDLAYHLGADAPDAVWAYIELLADEPLSSELWLGADGPATLALNGEPLVELSPADGHQIGEARRRLHLPAGRSGLLLKVARGAAGFGFSVLLCGQPGCLPLGLHLPGPDEAAARAAVERAR